MRIASRADRIRGARYSHRTQGVNMTAKTKRSSRTAQSKASGRLEGSRARGASDKPQMQQEPKPPFPKQKQSGVGLESKLDPKPRYQASKYKAAGKLEGKCALVTGGDSGIGRAVDS